jgi:hypothetical protein
MTKALLFLVLAGCGGSSDLTCAVLADPNNCWAAAAAGATSCLAMHATPGMLSADRTQCTWSDGSTVTFDAPLPTDTAQLDHLSFTVTAPGCSWSFTDTFMNKMLLTVDGKTEVSQLHPDHTFELACHDGTSYETDFSTLFTCAGSGGRAPTDGFEVTPTSVSFTISAVNAPSPLFTCTQ